ncbi:hypothetical protein TNCV_4003981 [Trichonephila clavipes]|nr:hypothetical protein TNCV_4003981 [Trichonephila clavipes]
MISYTIMRCKTAALELPISAVPLCCADLSLFRALDVEDLRAPLALVDRNLLPENLVISPAYPGPFGPLHAPRSPSQAPNG